MGTRRVALGDVDVGDDCLCWIAAELGVNHDGSPEKALRLAAAAVAAGADGVKIQKRTPELHARPNVMRESAAFSPGVLVSDLQHRAAMELPVDDVRYLFDEVRASMAEPFASPWDVRSVEDLIPLRPLVWKIASPCARDLPLLEAVRDAARETCAGVILSTGMSTPATTDRAVDVLGTDRLIILHCVSTYPAEFSELNLRRMKTLRERYDVPVGWSGHEQGIAVSLAAVAMGACVIERHLTLDRTARGSDHAASLEPEGFRRLVRDVRAFESALGDGSWPDELSPRERAQEERLRRVW